MKGLALLMILGTAAIAADNGSHPAKLVYYVQLIRGTQAGHSPWPGCKPVGPRLAEKFHSVFNYKHYWEVSARQVVLSPGQDKRVQLRNGREVEIDLRNPAHRTVAAFHDGSIIERTICPRSKAMTLIGGDNDRDSAWFVVVRRDKPGQ